MVNGFRAVPYITIPPSGAVIELWVGVPAICCELVAVVIAVWAVAAFTARQIINIEQKRMNAALLHAWDVRTPAKGKMVGIKAVFRLPVP